MADVNSLFNILFNEIHPAFRWLLTALTLGLFWFAKQVWNGHKRKIVLIETTIKTEISVLKTDIRRVDEKVDKLMFHLIDKDNDNE